MKAAFIAILPVFLIFVQPSLGVSGITSVGFLGAFIASRFSKKLILVGFFVGLLAIPLGWGRLAEYQKQRVLTFLSPASDPYGAGYNSIQSMISVGSGGLLGKGLGGGIQTQLAFLPEMHTDFIFAASAEELGFLGSGFILLAVFLLLYSMISAMDRSINYSSRIFLAAVFFAFFSQVFVHIGMNMGMLPVTGVPLPLVSVGGSSLIATMITLGMVIASQKR